MIDNADLNEAARYNADYEEFLDSLAEELQHTHSHYCTKCGYVTTEGPRPMPCPIDWNHGSMASVEVEF